MEYDNKYYINLTRFHDSLENAISEHLECLKFQISKHPSDPLPVLCIVYESEK